MKREVVMPNRALNTKTGIHVNINFMCIFVTVRHLTNDFSTDSAFNFDGRGKNSTNT